MSPLKKQGHAHPHPSVSYRLPATQKFVPFTCNPTIRTQRLHVNGTNFWVARSWYKTEGSMVLMDLFSTMGLPGPLRNDATQHNTTHYNATQRRNAIQCNAMLYSTTQYNAMPPHRIQGDAYLHPSVLYRLRAVQKFVPFTCDPEVLPRDFI